MKLPKITFWRVVFVLIVLAGAYSAYLRFFKGLGAATNLSDNFPWGIWIGFDALCGIMLTAGFRFSQKAGMAIRFVCAASERNLLHFAHFFRCFSSSVNSSGDRFPTTAGTHNLWNFPWPHGESRLASSPNIGPSLLSLLASRRAIWRDSVEDRDARHERTR